MIVPDEQVITQMMKKELRVDDYMSKPIDLQELCARVDALSSTSKHRQVKTYRRLLTKEFGEDRKVLENQFLAFEDIRIDVAGREVTRGDQLVQVGSPLLFDLLVYMVFHRGVVLTRERLLKHVWGYDNVSASDTRIVDYYVRLLRKKLEDDPDHPQLVQTVRGVGYRFKA